MTHGITTGVPRPFAFAQGRITALEIDGTIYSLPAVLRTCYKLSDRLHTLITREGTTLVTALWMRDGTEPQPAIVSEFLSELLDQQLREHLAVEAGPIRAAIVAQALAEGNLLTPEADDADYEEDPLGITGDR